MISQYLARWPRSECKFTQPNVTFFDYLCVHTLNGLSVFNHINELDVSYGWMTDEEIKLICEKISEVS